MNTVEMWSVLGIEPTKDEQEIVNAYRTKVVTVNPEDDQDGFMRLREAFEMAMNFAREDDIQNGDGAPSGKSEEEKTDIDRHIDKLDEIYSDIFKRTDLGLWKEWLADPLCTELDTTDSMREAVLVYIMEHYMLPYEVWVMLDEVFDIRGSRAILQEKFPEDFISFVVFRIGNEDFVNYEYIEPRADYVSRCESTAPGVFGAELIDDVEDAFEPEQYLVEEDSYLRTISMMQSFINAYLQTFSDENHDEVDPEVLVKEREKQLENLRHAINYTSKFDIWHPIEIGAQIMTLRFLDKKAEAIELAKAVLFTDIVPVHFYATSVAIKELIYAMEDTPELFSESSSEAEFEERFEERFEEEKERILSTAEERLETLRGMRENSAMSRMAESSLLLARKKYEDASDKVIEVLDDNQRNSEAVLLLKRISDATTKAYQEKFDAGTATENEKLELAWSYFRLEQIDPIFEILESFEPTKETFYGYNNLYGRCYSMKERYEEAEPYLAKWVEMMGELRAKYDAGEELSKKDVDRIGRAAFCYYMYGDCEHKLGNYEVADEMYLKAIEMAQFNPVGSSSDINECLYYMETYGKFLAAQKKHEDAMAIWNAMIEKTDHCVPAYIHRQETAHEMRDAQLVIDDYYNIIRDYPQYAKAYFYAAKVFMIYDQYDDAKGVFERAKNAEVESDMIDQVKARYFECIDDFESAEAMFEKIDKNIEAEETDLEDIADFYADAAAFFFNFRDENKNRIKLDKAQYYIKKGFEVDPENKRLLWINTDILEAQHKKPDSVYKKMLKLFPEDAQVNYEYGEYFRRQNMIKEAVEQYKKTLEKNPDHRVANNRLMNIYQDIYNEDEDKTSYEWAVKCATRQLEIIDDEYYRIERALLYLDGYDLDGAEEDAKKAIEFKDDNVYGYNALGLVYTKKCMYKEAIEQFDKAIDVMVNINKEDKTPVPYTNAARCFEYLGEFETAIEYIFKAVEKFGMTLNNRYNLARLYVKNREFDKATEQYEELISHYIEEQKRTGNKWTDNKIVRYLIKKVDVAILSGNDHTVMIRLNELNDYLQKNGYMAKDLDEKTVGSDRFRVASVFRLVADFYVNNMRQYMTAIQYFEKCIRFNMPAGTKGPDVSLADSKNSKPGIFRKNKTPYVEKPENIEGANLKDLGEMYRFFAAACYSYGLIEWANELGMRSLNCFEREYGTLEDYLNFPQAEPLRRSDVAQILFYAGKNAEAVEMLETVKDLAPCDFCNYGVCYDRFLTLARMAELTGVFPRAIQLYKLARKGSPDDPEIYVALKELVGEENID